MYGRLPKGSLHLAHTHEAIKLRLKQGPDHSYLRDFIYGGIDGAVTTFAVVAGVVGANLPSGVIIILGFANLLGDGFSMAVSNFLGTRAESQLLEKARKIEEEHIDEIPEGEREEVRQIYAAKGFKGKDLERVVDVITSDRKQWIDTMVQEEFGLQLEAASPWKAATITFFAFLGIGLLPLLSFLYQWLISSQLISPFGWSALLTGIAFFVVGALKSRFVGQRWTIAGLETLFAGGCAAGLAYIVGRLLRGVVDVL